MVTIKSGLLLASVLFVGVVYSAPDKAPPVYGQPYEPYASYKEVCTQKEWSSDTELCMPPLEQDCEQAKYDIKRKVRQPEQCRDITVPNCKVINKATRENLCSVSVETEETQLNAAMFSQEMQKKCQTHYVTECQEPARPRYGRYKSEPKCRVVPATTCYDIPVLVKKNVPVPVKLSKVEEECKDTDIPTPTSKCEDETTQSCLKLTKLEADEQQVYKCGIKASEAEICQKVRLTIPREFCYNVKQTYAPYKA